MAARFLFMSVFTDIHRGGARLAGALLAAAFVFCAVARATEAATEAATRAAGTQDLGGGLAYVRIADPGGQLAELEGALARNRALVVDLRGAAARMDAARALRAALAAGGGAGDGEARVARFVLVNDATAPAVSFVLGAGLPDSSVPGVVVIAPGASSVPADVKVAVPVEEDRLACEAIASGTAVASLINHQPEKRRYDETVLVRAHEGLPEPKTAAGEGADAEGKKQENQKDGKDEKRLTDVVLQAAVQMHRALVALKKLQKIRCF